MNDFAAAVDRPFVEVVERVRDKLIRNFWERSGAPSMQTDTPMLDARLRDKLASDLPSMLQAPFRPKSAIADFQLDCATRLVSYAAEIPVYREKYRRAGINPQRIKSWEEFRKIPPITKLELQAAYPDGCVHSSMQRDLCFQTRSSGSTGMSLRIMVDLEAIATDTLQGVRQFALQSGQQYESSDTVANIYTVPWWTGAIDGYYINHFISSLISPAMTSDILAELQPNIISLYPSNLEALMPYSQRWQHEGLNLIVTHSEQSSRETRRNWANKLGVSVLDEYSSEEGMRIALECPCGHYHSCDDTVILEIVDPETMLPQQPGKPGLVVITNLLNRAMPFIRYLQGDIATVSDADCAIQWGCIEKIQGRANDAFLTPSGRLVPAGTVLDATYRMMYDNGINLRRFELVQTAYDVVRLLVPTDINQSEREAARQRLSELLSVVMEHPIKVELLNSSDGMNVGLKHRPIKRQFNPKP